MEILSRCVELCQKLVERVPVVKDTTLDLNKNAGVTIETNQIFNYSVKMTENDFYFLL